MTVIPAPRGKKPKWGGFAPKMLGFDLCQRIRRLLVEDSEHAYLADDARVALELYREDFRELLLRGHDAIQLDEGAARWWTFAGGQINHTLKYALGATQGWKVVADNFHLRIEGDGVSHDTVAQAVLDISAPAFWQDVEAWQRIIALVPPYRLSKFQPALPPRFQQEMLGRYLLDIDGTRRFLMGEGDHASVADLLREALGRAAASMPELPPLPEAVRPQNPIRYIDEQAELDALCAELMNETRVGLDVETTLIDRDLCVVQFATDSFNAVIDARAVDLTPVADLLEAREVMKVIHNASFEVGVFKKLGIRIHNIFDTLPTSRRLRGRKVDGGHGLGAVCERELGREMDKGAQTSDWTRRPLTERQLLYAALDAEVLLPLHAKFAQEMLAL